MICCAQAVSMQNSSHDHLAYEPIAEGVSTQYQKNEKEITKILWKSYFLDLSKSIDWYAKFEPKQKNSMNDLFFIFSSHNFLVSQ